MEIFYYASITIMEPNKIIGYVRDELAPKSIIENVKISHPNPDSARINIEIFLLKNKYIYENFSGIELIPLPDSVNSFYILAADESAPTKNEVPNICFAVLNIQSGLHDASGYYAAPVSSGAPLKKISIWEADT